MAKTKRLKTKRVASEASLPPAPKVVHAHPEIKQLIVMVFGWQVWLILVALLASFIVPLQTAYSSVMNYGRQIPYLFSVWGNFDGYHYAHVAALGYTYQELPFFPLFPIAISFVNSLFNLGRVISGEIITHLAFWGALAVVVKLVKLDLKKIPLFFFTILLIFPTAHYYGAVYNDAPFFFFACLCILWSRQHRWLLASIAGALATFTRLNGLALAVYMTCEYIWGDSTMQVGYQKLKHQFVSCLQTIWTKRRWDWLAIALIPAAFGLYLLFIQVNFGDWHMLFSAMSAWGQDKVTIPFVVFWRYFKIFTRASPLHFNYWVAVLEFSTVLFYGAVLFLSWNKIRFSYWVFMAVSFLIPTLTGTFEGMPRYGLHLYPLFLALYLLLDKQPRWVKIVYFGASAALQIVLIALFTRGFFVT